MFTGIIEQIAEVVKVESEGSNVHINLKSTITAELKIDQSVAHNGVCLTVVAINGDGGFQMTLQELGTIMQTGVDVKILILNI